MKTKQEFQAWTKRVIVNLPDDVKFNQELSADVRRFDPVAADLIDRNSEVIEALIEHLRKRSDERH